MTVYRVTLKDDSRRHHLVMEAASVVEVKRALRQDTRFRDTRVVSTKRAGSATVKMFNLAHRVLELVDAVDDAVPEDQRPARLRQMLRNSADTANRVLGFSEEVRSATGDDSRKEEE